MPATDGAVDQALPGFSLCLDGAEPGLLRNCLASLASQTLPLSLAREVLLVDRDGTPGHYDALLDRHPWLVPVRTDGDPSDYGARQGAVSRTTGEVIVLCDGDCVYEPTWLQSLLEPFRDPRVEVVAGETTTQDGGVYALAVSLTEFFPDFSGQKGLYPTRRFFSNNVAFRRRVLQEHPIPLRFRGHRGTCNLHAGALLAAGITLWCQPGARALHAIPQPSHFVTRFFFVGHDRVVVRRTMGRAWTGPRGGVPHGAGLTTLARLGIRHLGIVWSNLRRVAADRRRRALLPSCLPIVAAAEGLILLGAMTAWVFARRSRDSPLSRAAPGGAARSRPSGPAG